MGSTRITELSSSIAENSKLITEYLASKDLPTPSFDVNGLTELSISPADKEAFGARLNLIAAAKELHDLVLGPKEALRHLAWDVYMKSFHPSEEIDQIEVLIDTSPSITSPSTQYIISMWRKLFQYMEKSAMSIWRSNATLIPSICAV